MLFGFVGEKYIIESNMKIPIVNEEDEVIGYKERGNRDPNDICRITGLWVTALDGSILLARRAFTKKHHPGVWGPAVSGTVEEGETYESNILKEAEEEIGLKNATPVPGPKIRGDSSHQYFCQWFTAVIPREYPFVKRVEEVEEVRWFSKEEILKLLEDTPQVFLQNLPKYLGYFST